MIVIITLKVYKENNDSKTLIYLLLGFKNGTIFVDRQRGEA